MSEVVKKQSSPAENAQLSMLDTITVFYGGGFQNR